MSVEIAAIDRRRSGGERSVRCWKLGGRLRGDKGVATGRVRGWSKTRRTRRRGGAAGRRG